MFKIHFILLVIFALLTGCLDIEEDIWLNRDGSGKYQVSLDFKELFKIKNLFADEDNKLSEEDLARMADSVILEDRHLVRIDSNVSEIRSLEGIVDASYFKDKGVLTITFTFDHITACNRAYAILRDPFKDAFLPKYFFSQRNRVATRFLSDEKFNGIEMKDEKLDKVVNKLSPVFLARGDYLVRYHLPGKAKKVNNKRAKWSEDKKTIILHSSLNRLLKDPSRMEVIIKHKRK